MASRPLRTPSAAISRTSSRLVAASRSNMPPAPRRRLIAVCVFMVANRPPASPRLIAAAAPLGGHFLEAVLFGALFCQPVEIAHDLRAGQIKRLNVAVLLDELHDIVVRRDRRHGERLWGAGLHFLVAVNLAGNRAMRVGGALVGARPLH